MKIFIKNTKSAKSSQVVPNRRADVTHESEATRKHSGWLGDVGTTTADIHEEFYSLKNFIQLIQLG